MITIIISQLVSPLVVVGLLRIIKVPKKEERTEAGKEGKEQLRARKRSRWAIRASRFAYQLTVSGHTHTHTVLDMQYRSAGRKQTNGTSVCALALHCSERPDNRSEGYHVLNWGNCSRDSGQQWTFQCGQASGGNDQCNCH